MHAALLLLPESFTEEELYTQITNLSYAGDFRMQFGEDKNKVSNIVKPNIPYFKRLYEKIIESEKTPAP
jgi:translocator assembly and maintenance protein 41